MPGKHNPCWPTVFFIFFPSAGACSCVWCCPAHATFICNCWYVQLQGERNVLPCFFLNIYCHHGKVLSDYRQKWPMLHIVDHGHINHSTVFFLEGLTSNQKVGCWCFQLSRKSGGLNRTKWTLGPKCEPLSFGNHDAPGTDSTCRSCMIMCLFDPIFQNLSSMYWNAIQVSLLQLLERWA